MVLKHGIFIGKYRLQRVGFRIAESCLAHSIGNKTSQAYNRYDYVELRRPVMQLWSDFVEQCEKENA